METEIAFSLIGIVLLLVLSAFFSGSETALTAASRARMHHLERKGDGRAGIVNRLRSDKERLIGAILFGNNLVNILASALATSLAITWVGEAGVAYATLAMTALVLVFAEVLPKTYALNDADRVALAAAPTMRPIVWLFSPVTRAVQAIVRHTLRLAGIDVADRGRLLTPEDELRGVIDLHAREGGVVKPARDMLDSILDLNEVLVSEIMVHRGNMEMLDAEAAAATLVDKALTSPYTRLPLWRREHENIVGVLHAKDLLRAVCADSKGMDALDIPAIASEPWFVPETTTLREQLNAFKQKRAHFALVVDEYGALMGLVTLEDILEEIVGDIADEHDVATAGVRPQADGTIIVDGTVTIRDLNRQFEWDLPDDEAATIAGLVLHEAQIIPEIGQVFTFFGFRFEVLRRRRNQITSLRLQPPVDSDGQEDSD